ncbi:hypothetical protein [Azospirillum sp. B510]|uniref:hypothetical protein n=1 Tax=Azospirillum sp. (strain B510) TaxID=137722 RepID=UPI0002E7BD89|nr:hypothetical protein [Azospirillum sp. B510]
MMADRFGARTDRLAGAACGTALLAACLTASLPAVLLSPAAALAEESPFLPPKDRQDNLERRLQQRIDTAVSGLEERVAKAMVDALDGRARDGALPRAVEDALARRMAGPGAGGALPGALPGAMPPGGRRPGTALAGGAPPLPPLPTLSPAELVPSGATFVGCLDGQAFFQDRAGTPFLIDPRAFPATAGGPATCAR